MFELKTWKYETGIKQGSIEKGWNENQRYLQEQPPSSQISHASSAAISRQVMLPQKIIIDT